MNRLWRPFASGMLLCLTTLTITDAGELDLSWYTIDGGGAMWCTGGDENGQLGLSGTIGQPDAGAPLTGGDLELTGGFWTRAGGHEWPIVTPESVEPSGDVEEIPAVSPAP